MSGLLGVVSILGGALSGGGYLGEVSIDGGIPSTLVTGPLNTMAYFDGAGELTGDASLIEFDGTNLDIHVETLITGDITLAGAIDIGSTDTQVFYGALGGFKQITGFTFLEGSGALNVPGTITAGLNVNVYGSLFTNVISHYDSITGAVQIISGDADCYIEVNNSSIEISAIGNDINVEAGLLTLLTNVSVAGNLAGIGDFSYTASDGGGAYISIVGNSDLVELNSSAGQSIRVDGGANNITLTAADTFVVGSLSGIGDLFHYETENLAYLTVQDGNVSMTPYGGTTGFYMTTSEIKMEWEFGSNDFIVTEDTLTITKDNFTVNLSDEFSSSAFSHSLENFSGDGKIYIEDGFGIILETTVNSQDIVLTEGTTSLTAPSLVLSAFDINFDNLAANVGVLVPSHYVTLKVGGVAFDFLIRTH